MRSELGPKAAEARSIWARSYPQLVESRTEARAQRPNSGPKGPKRSVLGRKLAWARSRRKSEAFSPRSGRRSDLPQQIASQRRPRGPRPIYGRAPIVLAGPAARSPAVLKLSFSTARLSRPKGPRKFGARPKFGRPFEEEKNFNFSPLRSERRSDLPQQIANQRRERGRPNFGRAPSDLARSAVRRCPAVKVNFTTRAIFRPKGPKNSVLGQFGPSSAA